MLINLDKFKNSKFRSKFNLKEKDLIYIQEKGLETIKNHAKDFITNRLAPAFPQNDGKQTPFRGHPVFIAQHATATCCRGCLEKWWKIPKGRTLSEKEIEFIVEIIMTWISQNC